MSTRLALALESLDSEIGHARARLGGDEDVLLGLVGRGIGESLTPVMQEREAARQGLTCQYRLVDFDALGLENADLDEMLRALEARGFQGLNITYPFKQAVLAHLDELGPEARDIGAVNTVVFSDGRRIGHNTDCFGFAEGLRTSLPQARLVHVVQLGAGGAGVAVGHALMQLGVEALSIHDRDAERAGALAGTLSQRYQRRVTAIEAVEEAVREADGIVNTTPVGMDKLPGTPIPRTLLTPRHWLAEIVYFPRETEILRHARAIGCATMAGTSMAVYQAVKAFELFTGRKADAGAMSETLSANL